MKTSNTEDFEVITKIALNYIRILSEAGLRAPPLVDVVMDIELAHCNGCPLHLRGMLDGRTFDLVHDVSGIIKHMDHGTGRLVGHFWPRHEV
jgi:hypothetical protein